jgi:hypothetical protein
MARIEEVQAEGAGEGQHRGADDRLWAELKAAPGLRNRKPEEGRDGGCPAPTKKAIPIPDPPTSHDPSAAFFNTLANSANFALTEFSEVRAGLGVVAS